VATAQPRPARLPVLQPAPKRGLRYQGGSEAVRPEGVENEIVQTNEAIAASSDKTAGSIEKTEQRLGNYSTAAERLRPHAGSALQSDGRLL
jgi:hypothetical protein